MNPTTGKLNLWKLRKWTTHVDRITELVWNNVRPTLQAPKKDVPPEGKLLVLGDVHLSERERDVLKLGPKFCLDSSMGTVECLAMTRNAARYVADTDRDRFVSEGVDAVIRAGPLEKGRASLGWLSAALEKKVHISLNRTRKATLWFLTSPSLRKSR